MQRETPGVQLWPSITGGTRGLQIRTELAPSTHSSVEAHVAFEVHVERHVDGPPINPEHVVPPRHRVRPITQASPGIASGGFSAQTRGPAWLITHSSVEAQFALVVQFRRHVSGAPIITAAQRLLTQKVPVGVHGWPSIAAGS